MKKNSDIIKEDYIEIINMQTDIRKIVTVSCRASDEGHPEAAARVRRSGKTRRSIRALLSALLLASALILGGCSAGKESGSGAAPVGAAAAETGKTYEEESINDEPADSKVQDGTKAASEGSETAAKAEHDQEQMFPMVFENYGRELTIEKRPERVLTLGPNCTELFAALGLSDLVVGRSLVNHSRGPLPEYAEAVESIAELNHGSATREAILTSGADFIYALDWEISDQGLDIDEAESYGMKTYVNTAMTLEEQYQEILDLGRIFGVEERAEALVEEQRSRINAVEEKLGDSEVVDVLVYDSGKNGVFTCSGVNFESLLIELAGGRNIFSDLGDQQWVTVSYEAVLERDPDVIIVHDYDSPSVEEKIAEIKADPVLSQLECVKEDRFVSITLESVLPGDRMAYAVEKLAEAFHPELF